MPHFLLFHLNKIIVVTYFVTSLGAVYCFSRHVISEFYLKQQLSVAEEAYEQNEFPLAAKLATQVVKKDSTNLRATFLLYEISREFPTSATHLKWGLHLLKLDPDRVDTLTEVTGLLLHFGKMDDALSLLERTNPETLNHPQLLSLLAVTHQLSGNYERGLEILTEARELFPEDQQLILNEAKYRAFAGNRDSWPVLQNWPKGDPLRGEALAVLMRSMREQQMSDEAGKVGQLILSDPQIDLDIRISVWGQTYFNTADGNAMTPEALQQLVALKNEASSSVYDTYLVMTELNRLQFYQEILDWMSRLPEAVRSDSLITILYAGALIQRERWDEIAELLQDQERWTGAEEIQSLITICTARRTPSLEKRLQLTQLGKLAASEPKKLTKLIELSKEWQWDQAYEALLWALTEKHPYAESPLKQLHQYYRENLDAKGLLTVARLAIQRNPHNMPMRNNYALLSLLLGYEDQVAHRIALENYEINPGTPSFAVTYAFSEYINGDTQSALNIISKLSPETRDLPTVRFYEAVFLSQLGQTQDARKLVQELELTILLPEERDLLLAQNIFIE